MTDLPTNYVPGQSGHVAAHNSIDAAINALQASGGAGLTASDGTVFALEILNGVVTLYQPTPAPLTGVGWGGYGYGAGQIGLYWTNPTTGLKPDGIEYSLDGGSTWTDIGTNGGGITYKVTGLTSGASYTLEMRTYFNREDGMHYSTASAPITFNSP